MKITRSYIIVADGEKAKIYLNEGIGKGLSLISDIEEKIKPTRDLGVDKPGRAFDRVGEGRHAMEPRVDWHEQEKELFAKSIAHYLNENFKEFDRLYLVAPGKTTSEIKKSLNFEANKRLEGELHKDLTKIGANDLESHLGELVVV